MGFLGEIKSCSLSAEPLFGFLFRRQHFSFNHCALHYFHALTLQPPAASNYPSPGKGPLPLPEPVPSSEGGAPVPSTANPDCAAEILNAVLL